MKILCRWALIVFFLAMTGCTTQTRPWQQLVTRHMTTSAAVVRTRCSDHGSVFYSFSANGKKFSNVSHWVDQPCAEIKPGDTLKVYYDPVAPHINTTMLPEKAYAHYRTQSYTPFIVIAFLALVIVLSFFSRGR